MTSKPDQLTFPMDTPRRLFLTSDTHFNHSSILQKEGARSRLTQVRNTEEMNELLIERWNAVVSSIDFVFHLGDFSLYRSGASIFHRLNGHKHLVVGNHDTSETTRIGWVSTGGTMTLNLTRWPDGREDHTVFLCHYACATWPKKRYGSSHFFGHSHGRLQSSGRSADVGVDAIVGTNGEPLLAPVDIRVALDWLPTDPAEYPLPAVYTVKHHD